MADFCPLLEAETFDERILSAIATVMRERDIVVLDTYWGLDKVTGQPPEGDNATPADAAIVVEWLSRSGRFGLDLEIRGRGVREDLSQAELAREFARTLNQPILLSDCSHFGFSWLKHDPDGAVWEVVTNTEDVNDFNLLCDLAPDHPDFCPAKLIWPADAALPTKSSAAMAQSPWRACEGERSDSPRFCRHFMTPVCPKVAAAKRV